MPVIYNYPRFVEIKESHKNLIDNYSQLYPDYCTYTFGGLYNWSPKTHPTKISVLNENLIVKSQEFLSNKHEYVFIIGNNKIYSTINILLNDYNKIDLLPESMMPKLKKQYKIIEDSRNHNYIYSTKIIHELSSNKYRDKKRQIKKFLNLYENDLSIRILNTNNSNISKQIINLHKKWESKKGLVPIEKEATINYLSNKKIKKFDIGIYIKNRLVSYTLNDISNPNMVMGNFAKSDKNYKYLPTIYEYFTSSLLYLKGYQFINLEMDSGIENFAKEKKSWKPIKILKMYKIIK